MNKETDPRYQKVHKALQESLMRLIDQKPFAKITINELADLTEINRSTFYYHYPDILALLNDCLIEGVTLRDKDYSDDEIRVNYEKHNERTTKYLQFCFDHPDLYTMVLNEFQTNPYFSEFYETVINTLCRVQRGLNTENTKGIIPDRQIACYVLGGQARIVINWLLRKPSQKVEHLARCYDAIMVKVMCSLMGCKEPEWIQAFEQSDTCELF